MEDEASVRQASRQFLIRSGHTVLEATHGEDAIRASHEPRGPIHLLVTESDAQNGWTDAGGAIDG